MSMENFLNNSDTGKPKYFKENLFHCQFFHNKAQKERTGLELEPPN
jgi:hypothetical protein